MLKSDLHTYSDLTFGLLTSVLAFQTIIFAKWSEDIEAANKSVILSFLFLFGSDSIMQEKKNRLFYTSLRQLKWVVLSGQE